MSHQLRCPAHWIKGRHHLAEKTQTHERLASDATERWRPPERALHAADRHGCAPDCQTPEPHPPAFPSSSPLFRNAQGLRKPAAEAYQVVTSSLGVPPPGLIFVDDRRPNVDAAAALGWGAVHFTGAADLEDRLRAMGLEF